MKHTYMVRGWPVTYLHNEVKELTQGYREQIQIAVRRRIWTRALQISNRAIQNTRARRHATTHRYYDGIARRAMLWERFYTDLSCKKKVCFVGVISLQQYTRSLPSLMQFKSCQGYQPTGLLGIFLQCLYESSHANSGEDEVIPHWTCSKRIWGAPNCGNKTEKEAIHQKDLR